MNDYKVLEISGSGELSAVITAIDEKDARRLFREKYKASGQREITVTLIRENTPATKAQEREAVERIRAIVATLGPRSYVGTALEGCLEDAEVNIENDFGDSMKSCWKNAERRVAEAVKETAAVKEELAQVKQELKTAEDNVDFLRDKVIDSDDLTDIAQLLEDKIVKLAEACSDAANRIVEAATEPERTAASRSFSTTTGISPPSSSTTTATGTSPRNTSFTSSSKARARKADGHQAAAGASPAAPPGRALMGNSPTPKEDAHMTATFIKNMGTHRITLTRSEAEILAYSGTMYSTLLTAMDVFKGSDEFTIYGSKYDVEKALSK